MLDELRELAVTIAAGRDANHVLDARFRTADDQFQPELVYRSKAEIMAQAALSMVAQANHSRNTVLSILREPDRAATPERG